MTKKLVSLLVALVLLLSAFGASAARVEKRDGEDFEVPYAAIVFTNDVHCGIEDGWDYPNIVTYRNTLEQLGAHTLLIDAGDHVQGGPIGTLSTGGYIIDIMNYVGYDLAVPGNHEFDYGMDRFFELVEAADYPYVSSNFMHYLNGEPTEPVFDAYKMFELGELKIAFVGISTPESITKSTPVYFQDGNGNYIYGFCQDHNGDGVVEAAQAAVDAAKAEGADHVVVVGHCGVDQQSSPWTAPEIVSRLHGITAFIDGHSHTVINSTLTDADGNTVLHGQTGTKLANLGTLCFYEDGSAAISIDAPPEQDAGDPETREFIDGIKAQYEELLGEVIAYTTHDLTINDPETNERAVRSKETNLGDLCADAYRTLLDADIAFVNGGGVRANINAGEITFGNVLNVHPFGNEACLVEVTGQQILDALEMGARVCPDENGGFLQVSGLTYEIHTDMEANVIVGDDKMWQGPAGIPYRVQNVKVMDKQSGEYKPLELDKTYKLASHNYMLKNQGDGFAMFGTNNVNILLDSVMIDNAVLINFIRTMAGGEADGKTYEHIVNGYADPRGEGRIVIVENSSPAPTNAPADPTAAPSTAPTPTVPPTGAMSFAAAGLAALIGGASVVIFKRKSEQ